MWRFFLLELVVSWNGHWRWPVEQDLQDVSHDGAVWRLAAVTFALEGILALWIMGAVQSL